MAVKTYDVVRVKGAAYPGYGVRINDGDIGLLTSYTPKRGFSLKTSHRITAVCYQDAQIEKVSPEELAKVIEEFAAKGCIIPPKWSYLTGTDPEVFVVDEAGTIIPAFTFLPSKQEKDKKAMAYPGDKNAPFWDGFQAEYTISPVSCHAYGGDYIRDGLAKIKKLAPKGSRITHQCVLDVPEQMLKEGKPEHVTLGCSPSLNVYGPQTHLDGLDPSTLPFRFAGFHIHLGKNDYKVEELTSAIKLLDAVVAVASVSLLAGLEDDRRRRFYGLAGEYRLPSHGLEWRVLSSAVLVHPAVTHLVLDLARIVAGTGFAQVGGFWKADEDEVRDVVDSLDIEGARKILTRNKPGLQAFLKECYADDRRYDGGGIGVMQTDAPLITDLAERLIFEGAKNLLPTDLEANWSLGKGVWTGHSEGVNACMRRLKF